MGNLLDMWREELTPGEPVWVAPSPDPSDPPNQDPERVMTVGFPAKFWGRGGRGAAVWVDYLDNEGRPQRIQIALGRLHPPSVGGEKVAHRFAAPDTAWKRARARVRVGPPRDPDPEAAERAREASRPAQAPPLPVPDWTPPMDPSHVRRLAEDAVQAMTLAKDGGPWTSAEFHVLPVYSFDDKRRWHVQHKITQEAIDVVITGMEMAVAVVPEQVLTERLAAAFAELRLRYVRG